MAERIREALEDTFEEEVRAFLRDGKVPPVDRLHDYLTGVGTSEEPRVRLLFELWEDGTLDLHSELSDVPTTCFFLGDSARYQRSIQDWTALLGPVRPYITETGDPEFLDLWGAGDLMWRADRRQAEASRDFLTLLIDRPVGLWHSRVRPEQLQVLASDPWSGRTARRVAVPMDLMEVEQVLPGELVPTDVPLAPKPRTTARA